MKDREELVMCNCKDNKYHNLPGWHEDFCEYRKWWENDEAAEHSVHPTVATVAAQEVKLDARNSG